MAEANASGTRPSRIELNSMPGSGSNPAAHGSAYPSTKGRPPSSVPHVIHRSWRRAVTDRTRPSARIMKASPTSR